MTIKFKKIVISSFLILLSINLSSQIESHQFEEKVYLPKQKATVYTLLNELSKQTGLLFIYDSNVIDNEQVVKIKAGNRELKDAIAEVIGKYDVRVQRIGRHILITETARSKNTITTDSVKPGYSIIQGRIVDAQNNQPIAYGSIGIMGSSLGTISNQEGAFRLIIPHDMLLSLKVCFSHLGYDQQEIPFSSLQDQFINVSLQPRIMTLPEVIIKAINPIAVIGLMKKNIDKNYFTKPCYLTTFYREGIEYDDEFRSLSEAVMKLYKSSYSSVFPDQVHLLKMRKISNYTARDTLIAKMSSGIDASLKLDLIKEFAEFLDVEKSNSVYDYKYVESTIVDGQNVDVISFCQKRYIAEPHYVGKLYITSDDNALVRVEMQILPSMARKATDMFVSKQAQSIKLTVNAVNYIINYKKYGGHYFINHIRGDLYFKAKKKKRLFGSSTIHTWFETLPCKIDTVNVTRFSKSDRISPTSIFSETTYKYDHNFWDDYNSITLEQKIEDIIRKLSPKIEVMR